MGCTTNSKIVDEVFRRVYPSAALASEAERDGVYAVSLFVYDYEDEPSTPTVELSVNTEAGRSTTVTQSCRMPHAQCCRSGQR
jgi:hypothetical protein